MNYQSSQKSGMFFDKLHLSKQKFTSPKKYTGNHFSLAAAWNIGASC
jgi:hypothetical protein